MNVNCYCFFCDTAKPCIKFNYEHIIPQSLGGRLKSKILCCHYCNEQLGKSIDSALSRQFDFICTILNIKRERGIPPKSILRSKKENAEFIVRPGGIIERRLNIVPISNNELGIYYESEEELQRRKEEISKRRKILNTVKISNGKPGEIHFFNRLIFEFKTGSNESKRAIAKIAALFYLFKNGPHQFMPSIAAFINGIQGGYVVTPYYPESDMPITLHEKNIYHTVILKGDSIERVLYVFLELFSTFRYIIILNRDYPGTDIYETYSIDVLSGVKRRTDKTIDLKGNDLDRLFRFNRKSFFVMRKFCSLLAQFLAQKLLLSQVGMKIGNDFFEYRSGTIITKEIAVDLSKKLFTSEGYGVE